MNEHGGRGFRVGSGKKPPEIGQNHGTGTIFLGDYNGKTHEADTIRLHPMNKTYSEPLTAALSRHHKAIGYRTTALVKAALMGLEVECLDPENIIYQPNWRELLPYADWHYSEIESGEAWEHLWDSRLHQPRLSNPSL
jgi:hypothetical protein